MSMNERAESNAVEPATLDLSDNALEETPPLSSLPRLERLLLSGNALAKVPWRTLPSPSRLAPRRNGAPGMIG